MGGFGRRNPLRAGARIRHVGWAGVLLLSLSAALLGDRPTTPPTRPEPQPRDTPPPARAEVEVTDSASHVDLTRLASSMNLERSWDRDNGHMILADPGSRLRLQFNSNSRSFRLNGMRIFLGEPVQEGRNTLYVSQVDYLSIVRPLLSPRAVPPPGGPLRTIVLDPGHGGRDPGTRNPDLGLTEKEMTLDVAFRLRDILEAEGYRVVLTREDDTYVTLEQRATIANRIEADLFISIHFNAVDDPSVSGTETFILTPRYHRSTGQNTRRSWDREEHSGNRFDHWNAVFGYYVQRQLLHDLRTFDRGIKRARFSVLREVSCPAVLVEAGYLSHPREARRIGSSEYRDLLARSLAAAVDHYGSTLRRVGE